MQLWEKLLLNIKSDELKANRKNISQQIGIMKKNGEDTSAIQEQVRKQGDEIKALDEKQAELDELQKNLLMNIPNTPDETTPLGFDDSQNIEIKKE